MSWLVVEHALQRHAKKERSASSERVESREDKTDHPATPETDDGCDDREEDGQGAEGGVVGSC